MIERRQTTWISGAAATIWLLVIGLLVVLPMLMLLAPTLPGSGAGIEWMRQRLSGEPLQWTVLRSVAVALLACGLASAVAVPVAFVAMRAAVRVKPLLVALGILPMALPPFVGAALLDQFATRYNQSAHELFGTFDVHGNSVALVVVFALHYYPFILLSVLAGLGRIDPAFEESARNLGAGRFTLWRRIILPLATPGYVMGASLVVLRVIEDIGTPLVLGIEGMLAPQVLIQLGRTGPADPQLQLLALVLLGVSLLIAALAWSALLPPLAPQAERHCAARPASRTATVLAALLLPIVGLIALSPLLWLTLIAFGVDGSQQGLLPTGYDLAGIADRLGRPGDGPAQTLLYVMAAGLLTLLAGMLSNALTLTGGLSGRIVRFASTALFAVPGAVLALGYLHAGDRFDFTTAEIPYLAWVALTLIVAFKQLPYAQHLLAGHSLALHQAGIEVARNLGVPAARRYARIALPALAGTLGAIFLLGAGGAVLELSTALILMDQPAVPYAVALFHTIQSDGGTALWAIRGLLLVVAVAATLALTAILLNRRCRASSYHQRMPREHA